MMRWSTFPRSLLFAAAAGLGVIPAAMVAAPWVAQSTALSLYAVGVVVLYVGGIGKRWSHGIRISMLALALGIGLLALAGRFFEVAVGMTVVLAICRSGFVVRRPPARALAIEVTLGGAALVAAYLLVGPTWVGLALGFWAFMLVQSAFFLVAGDKELAEENGARDPFEVARGRAVELMDRL